MGTRGLCFGRQDSLAPFETMRSGHIFKLLIMYCPLGIFVLLVATCIQPSRKYLSTCLSQPLPQKAVPFSDLVVPDPPPPLGKPVLCTLLFLCCAPTIPPRFCLYYFICPGWLDLHNLGSTHSLPILKLCFPWRYSTSLPTPRICKHLWIGGKRGPANYEL